jgi:hypothetical protein
MTCQELFKRRTLGRRLNLNRFTLLHPDGRRLITGWFRRAWEKRQCEAEDSFEPFIFAWIALNGWAACITGLDRDQDWRDALTLSEIICEDFERLVADSESPLAVYAYEFHQLWPIFKAQEIRTRGLISGDDGNRGEVIKYYLDSGIRQFQPQCWDRHKKEGSEVPLDWPHTLAALYRVRCNLFHGEKAAHSEMDQLIVSSAFRVLVHFVHSAHYL